MKKKAMERKMIRTSFRTTFFRNHRCAKEQNENMHASRHGYLLQLQVLEAVCQRIHKPNLCVQKESVITLKLFK